MSEKLLTPVDAYKIWAPQYDTAKNPMVAMVEETLPTLQIKTNSVVELGCGTGRNLRFFADQGASTLIGFDISKDMLAIAKQRVPEAELFCHDISQPLPISEGIADLVLITLVLEHIENPLPVFQQAERILNPGGTALALELHPRAFQGGSRAKITADDGTQFHTAAWMHSNEALDQYALQAGFSAGSFEDLYPTDEIAQRFPSNHRGTDQPWILVGRWVSSPT